MHELLHWLLNGDFTIHFITTSVQASGDTSFTLPAPNGQSTSAGDLSCQGPSAKCTACPVELIYFKCCHLCEF